HDDTRVLRVKLDDEERFFVAGKTKTFALADCEMDHAIVAAEHLAVEIDDIAGSRGVGAQLFHYGNITAFGNKTDVLTIRLVGDEKAQFGGDGAHIALFHATQREAQERQLFR